MFRFMRFFFFWNISARTAALTDSVNVTNAAHRIQFHWGNGTIPA